MNILNVAYPLFPVSSNSAGGAEQILFLLERELVARGHKSMVVAAKGSRVSGDLMETPGGTGEITDAVREHAERAHLGHIERALERCQFDLMHFHGLDFPAYVPRTPVRKIATLHLPLGWYAQSIFQQRGVRLCCVSESQAQTAPKGLKLAVIPNGIDVERYRAGGARREYLLWLGRVCPEKGTDIALRVAHRLDLPLIVAGPVHAFAYHEAYFQECVAPLLDQKRRYVGAVGLTEKCELLAEARCVLIPSVAAETGSLVAMEAASSGSPVVAFRSGALPEIVEDGVTGFVVDSEEEMAEAVERTGEISFAACRQQAVRRFKVTRMVEDYINLYRDVLASE